MRLTPEQIKALSDDDFLQYAYKGDKNALRLGMDVIAIADTWDNLLDGDKEVSKAALNGAFIRALIDIPSNPFFQAYQNQLLPVFRAVIVNWFIANDYEATGSRKDLEAGHTLRYAPLDVLTNSIAIIGGIEWAAEVGPELRRRSQKDELSAYLKEHGHAEL